MGPEHVHRVGALRLGAVRHDHDLPAERPHAGEERGGPRQRRRLAKRGPRPPAHGVERPALLRLLNLVHRVVDERLVGVADDRPGAGCAGLRLALDVRGRHREDLQAECAVLGREPGPADGRGQRRSGRGCGDSERCRHGRGCRGRRRHGGRRWSVRGCGASARDGDGQREGKGDASHLLSCDRSRPGARAARRRVAECIATRFGRRSGGRQPCRRATDWGQVLDSLHPRYDAGIQDLTPERCRRASAARRGARAASASSRRRVTSRAACVTAGDERSPVTRTANATVGSGSGAVPT